MNKVTTAAVAIVTILVAGCAAKTPDEYSRAMTANTAIEDFIEVEALKRTDEIRSMQALNIRAITDRYAILSNLRASYLTKYMRRCADPHEHGITPDIRRDGHTLRAREDTLRGCRIESIYEISDAQADELMSLRDAPG